VGALRPRTLALVAALAGVAAGVVALVLVAARRGEAPKLEPKVRLSLRTSFEPPSAGFGDPVTARAVVLLDRDQVRPETLSLTDDLAPLTRLGPVRTTRTERGRTLVVSAAVRAACLTDPCVAKAGETSLELPAVLATVTTKDGRTLQARARWPVLAVRSRVGEADLRPLRPPFRDDVSTPPLRYRVTPGTLAGVLEGVAVLAVLGVLLLVALELRALVRRRRAAPPVGDLEHALRLAREAEGRPAPDRRRALGLVARVVQPRSSRLAGAARELAWAEPKPEPGELSELVGEIEREVAP
jgi:hypothetical protein